MSIILWFLGGLPPADPRSVVTYYLVFTRMPADMVCAMRGDSDACPSSCCAISIETLHKCMNPVYKKGKTIYRECEHVEGPGRGTLKKHYRNCNRFSRALCIIVQAFRTSGGRGLLKKKSGPSGKEAGCPIWKLRTGLRSNIKCILLIPHVYLAVELLSIHEDTSVICVDWVWVESDSSINFYVFFSILSRPACIKLDDR